MFENGATSPPLVAPPGTTYHYTTFGYNLLGALVESAGRSWAQHGGLADSILFGYIDLTAELGHHVEVMEIAPGFQSYLDKLQAESDIAP